MIPSDTTNLMRRKQIEIIQAKSNEEKLKYCASITDFCYNQAMQLLEKNMNTLNKSILKIAYINTHYKNNFSSDELNRIAIFFNNKN
jgi:hypothetical protein